MQIARLPLADVYGNPDQPRKTFEPTALRELADSIRENGLIQPITVRPDGGGRYMIVAGERRFRAHELLQPEVTEIAAQVVDDMDDAQLAINAIVENDQRVDVSALETARAYDRAMREFGLTVDELARKVGKAPFRIQERLDLLRLGETGTQLLASGAINPTEAWYVAKLPEGRQSMLLKAIAAGQCPTNLQLKAVYAAILTIDAQDALFAMPADEATPDERRTAKSFEEKVEQVAALLRSSITDNQVRAVRRVSPGRCAEIADLFNAMQADLKRIETAFRVAAAGAAIAKGD